MKIASVLQARQCAAFGRRWFFMKKFSCCGGKSLSESNSPCGSELAREEANTVDDTLLIRILQGVPVNFDSYPIPQNPVYFLSSAARRDAFA
ncbi:hypothetical protein C1C98_23670 [Pseudomonas ogarae]|uniref:Uncharacterized protein n=1 Tax=Pseudomonas ogarae (strain DSM 112162 / CECT 30235 / F113) TaxID=1114970 RepID=A0ABN5GC78_PSEO1|nr:hypothetical protein C1C98_23670 [Pseudomonas ogarae]